MDHYSSHALAVVGAAVMTFALGALWYSPLLFGRLWVRVHGYSEAQLAGMKAGAGRAYGLSLLCYVVMAAALAVLIHRIGIDTVLGGLKLGLICWGGFAATIGLTANLFSDKPIAAYLIDAGYQLVYLLAMAVLLAYLH